MLQDVQVWFDQLPVILVLFIFYGFVAFFLFGLYKLYKRPGIYPFLVPAVDFLLGKQRSGLRIGLILFILLLFFKGVFDWTPAFQRKIYGFLRVLGYGIGPLLLLLGIYRL